MENIKPKQFRDLQYRIEDATMFGYVLRDRIVILSFYEGVTHPNPHPVEIFELPLNASAQQLYQSAVRAIFKKYTAGEAEAGIRAVKKLSYYRDIRPLPLIEDERFYACQASRAGFPFLVTVGFEQLFVDSRIPGKHMFSRRFPFGAAAKQLGPALKEAIELARHPPESRFPWDCFTTLLARKAGLGLFSRYHDGEDQYDLTFELLNVAAGDAELGSAVFAALQHRAKFKTKKAAAAAQKALQRDPNYRRFSEGRGGPGCWVYFDGAHDREHLSLDTLDRGGPIIARKPIPVDCDAATLGAEIRKVLKKLGVDATSIRAPELPIEKLFSRGGYRGLIVRSARKQSEVHAALQAVTKAKLVEWAEKARELGEPKPCACRLRDAALEDIPALLAQLRRISTQCHVELTVSVATKSTDLFVYAQFRNGTALRTLVYGIPEQHSWSAVSGSAQTWESDMFDSKVVSPKSDCVITDAMQVTTRALQAAYR